MAWRIEKVNSVLEREIGNIILTDFDFPPDVLVTVTRVETSSNVIQAKVYVSVMPEKEEEKIFNILNRGVYAVQRKVNQRLRMRPVPRLIFVKDEAVKNASRIEELLHKNETGYLENTP